MWFLQSKTDVLEKLGVDPDRGLSGAEAAARLSAYGPNRLKKEKKKTILQMFVAQLQDWLIYVLLAAVVVTLAMGEYMDAGIIILVVILNATLGVTQGVKAGNAIEALQKMSSPRALARRDGVITEVDSEDVVPGDILVLDAGRFIAADIRLIESANLQLEESALTGESVPASKDASALPPDPKTPLADRKNCAFMSTYVTYGRGVGVVVATGMQTEVGRIARNIATKETKTPLEIRLDELGKILGKLAIGVCVFLFVIALFQGRGLAEMFLTSVSLAVASIPEGLAAIVAVVLSIGVTNMSRRNAIVKRLVAVETLGSVNIICSDKTGTLTQNKMAVTHSFTLDNPSCVAVDGEDGHAADARFLARVMVLCSDATYVDGTGTGDPTEIALLAFGDALGLDRSAVHAGSTRVGEFSFDSERKLMSTLNHENEGYVVYAKGAIDNLLKICTHVRIQGRAVPLSAEHVSRFTGAAEGMAGNALRTLGAAYKPAEELIPPSEMEKDLILVGLVGMIDRPRLEVQPAIQKARQAGVTTLMITGDHKTTAFAIGRELGIAEDMTQTLTGQEMDDIGDEDFKDRIAGYRIFARVSPEHKVRIVKALQSRGYVVSMTGDGVNDAPSLSSADIGIAMGVTGTDVAKSAADMILADDNFATIVSAIEQGRNIYSNIKKSVTFLITCNLGEVVAMFFSLLAGWNAPLIATQILWINLLTDSLPAIALGMDPGDPDIMREKPRDPGESFFAGGAGRRAALGGLSIGALTMFAFWFGHYEHGFSPGQDSVPLHVVEYARTMAFMVLVACQLYYSLAFRNSRKSVFAIGIFSNQYLIWSIVLGILLQSLLLCIPGMREAFNLQMLDLQGWGMALVLGFLPLAGSEVYKLLANARIGKDRGTGGVSPTAS